IATLICATPHRTSLRPRRAPGWLRPSPVREAVLLWRMMRGAQGDLGWPPQRGFPATAALPGRGTDMRDYLAWRLAFGVTTPSTNTVVQPEYDDMRPPGVTNHLARMVIPEMPIRTNDDFDKMVGLIDAALEDADDRVMDCKPNA